MARSAEFIRSRSTESRSHDPYVTDDEEYDLDEPKEVEGRSYEEERDWRGAGAFTLGAVAGALVGAGVALLLAPQSGEETRDRLATHARRFRVRADEGWDDLRDELRRLRRHTRRAATRGRWKVEDMID
jgi:hypothetical protein